MTELARENEGSEHYKDREEIAKKIVYTATIKNTYGVSEYLREQLGIEADVYHSKLQKADPQNRTSCKSGAGTNPVLKPGVTPPAPGVYPPPFIPP